MSNDETLAPFDQTEILASISASAPRRWLAVCAMYFLGALLLYIALSQPADFVWKLFLLGVGAASLWLGEAMRKATLRKIHLTPEGLFDTEGEVIARLESIQNVDRGVFAFKPSNGFLIRTKTAQGQRRWLPGLWWRVGRQIGVGGVTPGAQTKFLTEILSGMIAERDGEI
ncbi:MAG: hypothetical protein AB8B71_10400 [Paracoccaceae bacterium]